MSFDMEKHLIAADHISDARRCLNLIEMAVRHNTGDDRDPDYAAIAHVAYLAVMSLEKAEAKLDEERPQE